MSKPDHDRVLDLLKMRDRMATDVTLDDGRVVRSHNIAWGFDLGDPVAHFITNISPPNPERELPIDFFYANQVL